MPQWSAVVSPCKRLSCPPPPLRKQTGAGGTMSTPSPPSPDTRSSSSPPLSPTGWFSAGARALSAAVQGPLLFLPASQLLRMLPCAPPHPSPPQAASGEPLHYLHTLSSSQNPFSGWQAGKHSAPGAQERLRHSLHEARQAGEAAPALWGLYPPGPQSGTPSRATQGKAPACSWVWGHHSTLPSSRGPVRHPASLRETTNVRPARAEMRRQRTKRA